MACFGHDFPVCRRVDPMLAMIPFLYGNRVHYTVTACKRVRSMR
jgi:hypothetical protein